MSDNYKSWLQQIPGIGILAVIVVALFGQFSGKPTPPATTSAAPATPTLAAPAVDAPVPAECAQEPPHVKFLCRHGILKDKKKIAALIVTVPDPRDTQFGFWFDQAVESVCRAMGESHFVLERHWYPEPWLTRKDAAADRGDPRQHPGVIVFRSVADPGQRWIVLLVGENPVNGLHAVALRAAFDFCRDRDPDKAIHGVGPFFSGSQPSLLQGARDWPDAKGYKFRFYSGSALSLNAALQTVHFKDLNFTQKTLQVPFKLQLDGVIEFLGQLEGRKIDRKRVAFLLEMNSGMSANIKAFDTGTKSPENMAKQGPWDWQFPSQMAPAPKPVDDKPPAAINPPTAELEFWRFRFPMHISMLGGLRSQERREIDVKFGLRDSGNLTGLDANRKAQDLLPAMEEARTAFLNRGALDDFWSVIRREQIRYVLVMATDPRDVIFLVEELRRECPNVQPILFGADRHYTHPSTVQVMRGAWVSSTYPLNLSLQQWMKAGATDARRIPFASAPAEGLFNAVLAIQAHKNPTASRGYYDNLLDYRLPTFVPDGEGKLQPSFWISVIDEGGRFAPVRLNALPPGPDREMVFTAPEAAVPGPTRSNSPPPSGVLRIAMTVVLIAGILTVLVWYQTRLPRAAPFYPHMLRSYYQTVMALELWFLAIPFGLHYWKAVKVYDASPSWRDDWSGLYAERVARLDQGLAIACMIICFGGPILWVAVNLGRRLGPRLARRLRAKEDCPAPQAPPKVTASPDVVPADPLLPYLTFPKPFPIVFALTVLLAFQVASIYLLDDLCTQETHADIGRHALFLERSAVLLSGYSVIFVTGVVSLGIAAYCGIGLLALVRQFNRLSASPFPTSNALPATNALYPLRQSFQKLARTHLEIHNYSCGPFAADAVWRHPFFCGSLVAVFLILFLNLVLRAQPTVEGRHWDNVFWVAFALLFTLIAFSFVRVYILWRGLTKLLTILGSIPIMSAFDRLPARARFVAVRTLLHGRWRDTDLTLIYHLLKRIRDKRGASPPAAPAGYTTAETQIDAIQYIFDHDANDAITPDNLKPLTMLSRTFVEELHAGWLGRSTTKAFGGRLPAIDPAADETEDESDPDWKPLAEQFIAMMTVFFLAPLFDRLRKLSTMLAIATATLMAAATSYAFQPERAILFTAAGISLAVAAFLLGVVYAANSNELVRRVDSNKPGSVLFDAAFLKTLITVIVPLVGLTITLFNGRLRALFEPVLTVVR